jgi:hypothetical protein
MEFCRLMFLCHKPDVDVNGSPFVEAELCWRHGEQNKERGSLFGRYWPKSGGGEGGGQSVAKVPQNVTCQRS